MSNLEKLKALWKEFNSDTDWKIDLSNQQFAAFQSIDRFEKGKLQTLRLEEYTNILTDKNIGDNEKYFTWWIERGTEKCGKFRTASSYAYGVYKVNSNNVPKEFKKTSGDWKEKAKGGYRSVAGKGVSKDKFLTQKEAGDYFEGEIKTRLIELATFENGLNNFEKGPLQISFCRKVAYLYNPEKLLPIYSKDVILSIAEFLGEDTKKEVKEVEDKITVTVPILNKLKAVLEFKVELDFETTQKLGAFLWHYFGTQVSFDKNTIFYGAPGTGKTYSVIESVKQKAKIEGSVYKIVQFHPGFSYEDFIDGLKPKLVDGNVSLTLVNGVFKEFCIKATKALIEFRKNPPKDKAEPPKYYFIVDEINRAELSAVFGEILSCLEEDKRLDFDKDGNLKEGLAIASQNSYLIANSEDAVYTDQTGRHLFGIPSNIVFIGTMNDIDRSVDTFDFALRRRFTWIHKGFDAEVLATCDQLSELDSSEIEGDADSAEKYIASAESLNKYIADELGLGRSYEIGHAYFMKVNVSKTGITKASKKTLFDQHLAPLLEEYLRSEYSTKEIEMKIKEAKNKFGLS